jgi:hypothetical protein
LNNYEVNDHSPHKYERLSDVYRRQSKNHMGYGDSYFVIISNIINKKDLFKFLSDRSIRTNMSVSNRTMDNNLRKIITAMHDAWFMRRGWSLRNRRLRSVNRLLWANLVEGATGDACDIEHADWDYKVLHRHIIMEVPDIFNLYEVTSIVENSVKNGPEWLKNVSVRHAHNSIFAYFSMIDELREPLAYGEISMPPLSSDLYLDDELYGRNRIAELCEHVRAWSRQATEVTPSPHV